MAYPEYEGPEKSDKGKEGGSCNRSRCQDDGAVWYNHGSYSWYCPSCRKEIQFDSFNLRDWEQDFGRDKGHPMFETREMMTARGA